jgi:hypothetical protein
MKLIILMMGILMSFSVSAQKEEDTLYKRCPVSVLDTATGNDYFSEHQPATVTTSRSGGDIKIVIEQRNQFFTLFFHARKFKSKGKYKIMPDAISNDEVSAKYSFRSGESVAYIDVSKGTIETLYDKATKLWHIKLIGLIANLGDTRVTYFKASADFYIR